MVVAVEFTHHAGSCESEVTMKFLISLITWLILCQIGESICKSYGLSVYSTMLMGIAVWEIQGLVRFLFDHAGDWKK